MPGLEQFAPAAATDDDTNLSTAAPGGVDLGRVPRPPAHEPAHEPAPAPDRPDPVPAALPRRPVRHVPASGERKGTFLLGEVLGHGGFAHVYRATAEDGSEVAVKVLTGLQEGARERFAQEVHLLEAVGGRGYPAFVGSDLDDDQPWFAMELVPGVTLRDHVRATGPLDGPGALRLAAQVASALLVLQEQHCVHRDLKPANVMVDGDRAVLLDLGIAKMFDAATSTQPVGTLAYMAPELFARRVHPRSDVYALGLLLIFASTGVVPADLNFLGRDLEAADLVKEVPDDLVGVPSGMELHPSPSALPAIDPHLQDLILSMTRYQPNHRPALENVAEVLRARLAGEAADETLLLTQRIVHEGPTATERALGAVAEMASATAVPVRAERTGGDEAPRPDAPASTPEDRAREPWHGLVYDATLMSVLSEAHNDGFDGAAAEVIADHVASIGAHVADGRTPAEIKDWLWQAMRWHAAVPPDGHADTLRGWRAYRHPQQAVPRGGSGPVHGSARDGARPEPVRRVSTRGTSPASPHRSEPAPPSVVRTRVLDVPDLVATQVARPVPPSVRPRQSSVQHLGPAPRPPSVRPRTTGPAGGGGRPASAPARQPVFAQPAPPVGAAHPGQAVPPQPRAATPARAAAPARGAGWGRVGGAVLSMVPRLLALAAVLRMLLLLPEGSLRRSEPFFGLPAQLLETLRLPVDAEAVVDGPLLATGALVVAILLRLAGRRTWTWLYALVACASVAAAVVLAVRA